MEKYLSVNALNKASNNVVLSHILNGQTFNMRCLFFTSKYILNVFLFLIPRR